MGRLEGKVAIVTGGGSGIGRSSAQLFHREGARVLIADVTGAEREVADQLGQGATGVHADVSDSAQVAAMIDRAVSEFGALDVLFNNAGIDGRIGALDDDSEENFDRVIAVNLKGTYLGMKHAIPVMRQRGGGSIINTASVAGLVGMPLLAVYCASKGGVVQLTKAAAAEYAPAGIRVNAICPGIIDTPLIAQISEDTPHAIDGALAMTPLARRGQPAEMAQVACFLASDDASFVTGAALPADGGYTAW